MTDPTPRRPPGPHPSPEELYEARHGATGAAAERVREHAVACAVCSEELLRQEAFDSPQPLSEGKLAAEWARFNRALDAPAAAPRAPGMRAMPAPSRRFARPPALALAAALAAVLGLTAWLATRQPADSGPAVAAPAPREPVRGGPAEETGFSPAGTLGAPPAEFLFPAADGEPRRVLVFDFGGSYRWTSEPAAGGKVGFPEAERQRLAPGVEYFWTVLDENGGSPARSFRIQPP